MRSFSNRQTHPIQGHFHLFCLETRLILMAGIVEWFLRRKQRIGVLQKGIFPTLKHPQKKISMLMLHSCVLPRLLLPMSTNKTYIFKGFLRQQFQKMNRGVDVHADMEILNLLNSPCCCSSNSSNSFWSFSAYCMP